MIAYQAGQSIMPLGLSACSARGGMVGWPHLAVGKLGTSSIAMLLGDGMGRFSLNASAGSAANQLRLAAGDFNNDGILDLAAVDNSGSSVSVLLGTGSGTFNAPVPFGTRFGPAMPHNAQSGMPPLFFLYLTKIIVLLISGRKHLAKVIGIYWQSNLNYN